MLRFPALSDGKSYGMVTATENTGLSGVTPTRHRLWRYGPLVLWSLLIFFASTSFLSGSNTAEVVRPFLLWLFPHASEATLNFIHGILIRKGAHFTEYAIFALLAARALRTSSRDFLRSHWLSVALAFVVVYALGDEFHQSFVPSRTASIYDSMIDTCGGLAALCLLVTLRRRSRRLES
jgi:Predicted integral membrane protein